MHGPELAPHVYDELRRLAASSIYSSHAAYMDPLVGRVARAIEARECDGLGFSRNGAYLFLLNGWWPSAEALQGNLRRRSELTHWHQTSDVATGSVGYPPAPAVLDRI
ncbi:MAG: hypothetical protein ACI8QZ_001663 [Chlamydiales bacterium]|jgi:hypothetical protein